jgi:hypothetical protein
MLPVLKRFHVHTRGRLAPVASWLTAMVDLFNEELAGLLRERDARIAPMLARGDAESVFEDRGLEVLSECPALLPPKIVQLGL